MLGRWESSSEWAARTEFSVAKEKRKEDMAQGATMARYDMARRNNAVERVALQQNVAKLPFTNARLAASMGSSVEELRERAVSKTAVNVVFDALSESKSGLLAQEVADQRRAKFFTAEGAIDEGALAAGLYKSRVAVMTSWLVYGKGRIYGFAVFIKLVIDKLELKDSLGAVGPYVDYLLFLGAFVLAVQGVQKQADVEASTSDYETLTLEEAEAEEAANQDDDGQYSTVFEKLTAAKRRKSGAPSTAASSGGTSGGTPGGSGGDMPLVPVAIMIGGILSVNILGGH